MKRFGPAVVVIVLLLVIAFGVGQFFAIPPQTPSAQGPSAGPQGPSTQVIAYVPPQPVTSTPVESGSCWTNSIAAPFRSDAWRCTVGNAISDPCFMIPGSKNLLCDVDPAGKGIRSPFVLKLTKALPNSQIPPSNTIPADWAWLIALQDGTICSPFTGTLPIAQGGIAASYGCAPKVSGGEGMLIFGDLNTSSSLWTADVGMLAASTSGLPSIVNEETIPVAAVWQ